MPLQRYPASCRAATAPGGGLITNEWRLWFARQGGAAGAASAAADAGAAGAAGAAAGAGAAAKAVTARAESATVDATAALARGVRRLGGTIVEGAAVEDVLSENGRATGVTLESGETAASEHVVHACGMWARRSVEDPPRRPGLAHAAA